MERAPINTEVKNTRKSSHRLTGRRILAESVLAGAVVAGIAVPASYALIRNLTPEAYCSTPYYPNNEDEVNRYNLCLQYKNDEDLDLWKEASLAALFDGIVVSAALAAATVISRKGKNIS